MLDTLVSTSVPHWQSIPDFSCLSNVDKVSCPRTQPAAPTKAPNLGPYDLNSKALPTELTVDYYILRGKNSMQDCPSCLFTCLLIDSSMKLKFSLELEPSKRPENSKKLVFNAIEDAQLPSHKWKTDGRVIHFHLSTKPVGGQVTKSCFTCP